MVRQFLGTESRCRLGSGLFGGGAPDSRARYSRYEPEKMAPGYKNLVSPDKKLKVFWMLVGTEDPRVPYEKQTSEDFQKHGIGQSSRPTRVHMNGKYAPFVQ